MLWFEHMFGGQWASGVWGSLWSEESICTESWSNTGCGNPRRVIKAFAEEGGPTQGVRAQEGLGVLPCKNQPGEECHSPSGKNSSLYRRQ